MKRESRSAPARQRLIQEAQDRSLRIQNAEIRRQEAAIAETLAGCTVPITTGPVVLTVQIPGVDPMEA